MQEGGHYIQLARWMYAFMSLPMKIEDGLRYVNVTGLPGALAARFLHWLGSQDKYVVMETEEIQWVDEGCWQDWCQYSLGLNIDEKEKEDA